MLTTKTADAYNIIFTNAAAERINLWFINSLLRFLLALASKDFWMRFEDKPAAYSG
jgi:hypothetical protein